MSSQKSKGKATSSNELPAIPEKLYFTIGEVGKLCDLKPHVLRYWEQEFQQLNPSKRRGNRRYYQRKDVLIVRKIRDLLYCQGFTIEGARQQMQNELLKAAPSNSEKSQAVEKAVSQLEQVLQDLQN